MLTKPPPGPDLTSLEPDELLARGRTLQAAGRFPESLECFGAAVDRTRSGPHAGRLSESLRWFAVVHQQQGETEPALRYARESHEAAVAVGRPELAAEALCTLAGVEFESGDVAAARATYLRARAMASDDVALGARVEGNLGILATVRGQWDEAAEHYRRALAAHEGLGDDRAAAEVLHNLAMLCADRRDWQAAHEYYQRASRLAELAGDERLVALCSLNRADLHLALEQYDEARRLAERALATFDRLNAVADKPDAYRMLGQVFRAMGLPTLAESRIRAAIRAAGATSNPLCEAEAWTALAELLAERGNAGEATAARQLARQLYERVGAAIPPAAA